MAFCAFPWLRGRVNDDVATYNNFLGRAISVGQLEQLNRKPGQLGQSPDPEVRSKVPGLARYQDLKLAWNTLRSEWMARGDTRFREMLDLGAERLDKMFEMVYAEQFGVHPDGRTFKGRVTPEDALRIYGVDAESYALRSRMDQDFKDFITVIEQNLLRDAARKHTAGSPDLLARQTKIKADFDALRAQPYFPLQRFGKYTLTIKDAAGRITSYEQFEKQSERDKAHAEAKGSQPSADVRSGLLSDNAMAFQGLPPNLIEALKTELNLTPDQEAELSALAHKLAPGQSFRKRLISRKKTAGFSEDGLRTYTSYFFHGANHAARITYANPLRDALVEIQEQGRTLPDSTKLDGMRNMLGRDLKYILEPQNEFAALRAFGFLWYLGFLPKAAAVNFTQMPLVAYPYLAARYSDARAVGELGRATKDTFLGVSKDKNLAPQEIRVMEQLLKEGKTNQSFATELGGVANGSFLGKAMKTSARYRFMAEVVGKGATLFSIAEQVMRRGTGLATFRLAVQDEMAELAKTRLGPGRKFKNFAAMLPADQESVYQIGLTQARDAIDNTMFEYSNWNRPDFMRGRKSAIFLFQLFVQNMLFFVARDPGSVRLLAMLFFFAGLQGLPFMEDIADLIDTIFSTKNKKFDVRKEAREFINTLGMDPDLLLHGTSHYGFGMQWVGDQLGLPLPVSNLSGSLSMGRVIPGFEALTDLGGAAIGQPLPDFEHTLLDFQEGAAGALAAIPMNILRGMYYDTPYTWKRMEMFMPTAARSVSRAIRYSTEGEETTISGRHVVDLDLTDTKTQTEIMLQSLGFTPTAITTAQRQVAKMKEVEIFYSARRRMLMSDYAYAKRSQDPGNVKGALDAISQYNRDVPYREMGIKRSELRESFKARQRTRRRAEAKLPLTERYERIVKETGEAFEP